MSATQAILKALWAARQARKPRPGMAEQVKREFYRRDLAERVRIEFYSRDAEGHEHKPPGEGGGQFTGGGSFDSQIDRMLDHAATYDDTEWAHSHEDDQQAAKNGFQAAKKLLPSLGLDVYREDHAKSGTHYLYARLKDYPQHGIKLRFADHEPNEIWGTAPGSIDWQKEWSDKTLALEVVRTLSSLYDAKPNKPKDHRPEHYDKNTEAGRRWVTIGAHEGEGGTPVQIDGSGQIIKGPAALKGKPADNPDGPPKDSLPQGESAKPQSTAEFDESTAGSELSRTGKASHGGHSAEIVDHPSGKQWGYAARISGPDGEPKHVHNGEGRGTSWREAQAHAVGALKGAASPPPTPKTEQPADPDAFSLQAPKNAPHQPKEHQGALFETGGKSDVPAGVVETPDGRRFGATVSHIDQLHVDPDRFQYKFSGIDPKTGVTKELKEVASWNPMFAGSIMVWRDPADGKDYVINGHHRAELAKRAKGKPLAQLPPGMEHDPRFKDADGNYNGKMQVMYVAAKSAKDARAAGAVTNIAEGRGKPIDAAKFMRDSGLGVDGFKQMGISLSGAVAEDGAILAGLSDRLFKAVAQGTMPEGRALAIGKHVTNPEFQDKLAGIIAKREGGKGKKTLPDNVVSEMAREMALAGSAKTTGKDLFGDFEAVESLFVERGELKAGLRAAIGTDARVFGEMGKRGREERLAEAGNVLNTEENSRRAKESAEAAWTFNQLANAKGPISDTINSYAKELKDAPGRKKTIIRQLTERIRELLTNGGTSSGIDAGGAETDRGASPMDAGAGDAGTVSLGPRSAGPAPEAAGSETVKEQFAREFASRGFGGLERYAAPHVDVIETSGKRSKVEANYRPAFGSPRCSACEFYRAGKCSQVAGEVRAEDFCDLFIFARAPSEAEKYAKESPGQRHLFDESKHKRGQPGNAGQFGPGGGGQAQEGDKPASGESTDAKPAKPAESTPEAPSGQSGQPADGSQPAAAKPENSPTPPPPGQYYAPDPSTGQASRVGVPAGEIPPPPSMQSYRLPNLAEDERNVETGFVEAYDADPDGMAGRALAKMEAREPGWPPPNTFETDAFKLLCPEWTGTDKEDTLRRRSRYNAALHQTANACCKRAFTRYLDETLSKAPPEKRNVLITCGGCGAGKGFCLGDKGPPEAQAIAQAAGCVWDSAGDQNGTENDWILEQCRARGISCHFLYVHADPAVSWAAEGKGVVHRAGINGRMITARVFADSYAYGAKNFEAFAQAQQGQADVKVTYIDNSRPPGEKPTVGPTMPPAALALDPEQLYASSSSFLKSAPVSDAVRDGGTADERYWPPSVPQ